jgi:hypothetical protein
MDGNHFIKHHRRNWRMPKPIRWALVHTTYKLGEFFLWFGETLWSRFYKEDTDAPLQWHEAWWYDAYNYLMGLSADLDAYDWLWASTTRLEEDKE